MSDFMHDFVSKKASQFTESVIREMTRVAITHNAVNLAQGFPDYPAPDALKIAAAQAIFNNENQYAVTWGTKDLRDAITEKIERDYQTTGFECDGCPNHCEIIEIMVDSEPIARWGDRCGKWSLAYQPIR